MAKMALTELQIRLLSSIQSAVEATPNRRIVYCTEWLGYLPFGAYHWIEVDGQDISNSFPLDWSMDWSQRDIEALVDAGHLTMIDEWTNPSDELEKKLTFIVSR
jgi:hypothetical protein